MGFLDAGWQHAVTRETEPSGKGRGAVSKEMILRQAQGKRLFYERSVLLRYMTGVKNALLTQPVGQKNYLETAPNAPQEKYCGTLHSHPDFALQE